jgi:hypothetical protein
MKDQQASEDTSSNEELGNLILYPKSPTHVAIVEENINIMWQRYQHKIVFTHSLLNRDMFINNKVPTSLTPKFP